MPLAPLGMMLIRGAQAARSGATLYPSTALATSIVYKGMTGTPIRKSLPTFLRHSAKVYGVDVAATAALGPFGGLVVSQAVNFGVHTKASRAIAKQVLKTRAGQHARVVKRGTQRAVTRKARDLSAIARKAAAKRRQNRGMA